MSDLHESSGFSAPDPDVLAPLFPGYQIEGLIATGGMGAVYRAVQRSLDRTVALKILPMEFSKDAAFCAGFEAEAKAMARLNHANLIGVYDFGEAGGMLYIIMEYVAGQSIYHAAYGQVVEQNEVVRLVTAVCNGLAHAHENGIIHRDIKPSNILLDLNGHPKIGDFGLARPAERKIEEGEEIFGTPHYTAPEVVDAPQSVNHRADIFSVGVMLHELLTGQLPASDPRPASTIVRCDPRFDAIVRRATQPLAAARYSSAAEMARDLQVIGSSLVQKAGHIPSAAAPRRVAPSRRHPVGKKKSSGAAGTLFVGLALVIGVGAYLQLSRRPAPPPPANPNVVVLPSVSPTPTIGTTEDPSKVPSPTPTPSAPPKTPLANDAPIIAPVEPAVPEAVAPKADVNAYFATVRKIMQDKAKSPISEYTSKLRGNVSGYQSDAIRGIAKVKADDRAKLQTGLEDQITGWRAADNRISEEVPAEIEDIPGMEALHEEYLRRQVGYENSFNRDIDKFSETYIAGLKLQIDRYQQAQDPGAADAIKAEIKETQADPAYFRRLMATPPGAGQ